MSIYLDIIFLENILMNYIILFATLVIVKSKAKHLQLRLIISSVIGSIYAIIVYLNIFKIYSNIIAKIILSISKVDSSDTKFKILLIYDFDKSTVLTTKKITQVKITNNNKKDL